jgi:soluble lytic murein transglycosylase-like protein
MAQAPRTMRVAVPAARALPDPGAARVAPVVVPGGAGAEQLTLAARVQQLTAGLNDRADADARGRAREAGMVAGDATPGARMEGGGALYQDAFNASAADAGARRLEITARDRLDELAREHEADPAAFAAAAAAFRSGMTQGLPPELQARAGQSFDLLARPYFNQAQERQRRVVADQAIATFNEAAPRRLAAIDRLGRASLTDPAAMAALRAEEQGALDDLVRLGPRTAFSIGGREYPADPTRTGALTAPQLVEQRQRILDAGVHATAMGAFAAGPQTERWIDDWIKREQSPQGSGLPPELLRRIERDMRSQAAEVQGRTREEQGRAWASLQERIGAVRAGLSLTGTESDRITDEELRAAGRTPEQIAGWRREVSFGQHAFAARREVAMADGPALDRLEARVMPGGDLFALNPAGALRIAETLAQRREGAARDALQQRIQDARVQAEAAAARTPRDTVRLPETWTPIIAEAATRHNVPEPLARALIFRESGGSAGAVSRAGAVGPAQIMAGTARDPGFGVPPLAEADRTDPAKAIPHGLRYLAALREHYGGDWRKALAAYNWGHANVTRTPDEAQWPAETRRYVAALAPYVGGTQPAPVTRAEAAAAGLTIEQMAEQNRAIEQAGERGRLRQLGAQGSPEEVAAARAALPLEGADAAENAQRLAALELGVRRRVEGVREQPADYVQAEFPIVAEQWHRALQEPARTGLAIQATLDAQERLGIPEAQRQPMPRGVAQAMVAEVTKLPTEAERLGRLSGMLGGLPSEPVRQQVLASLRGAGLPEGTRIGAAVLPRLGPYQASQVASDLAVDASKLSLPPSLNASIRTQLDSFFTDSDRIGGLRAAQREATGNGAFLDRMAQERRTLEHVVKVRAAAAGSVSSSMVTDAYRQLFGGNQVINEDGFRLTAPPDADTRLIREGLRRTLDLRLAGQPPGIRILAGQGTWVDGGTGYVFYPRGSPSPLAVDGALLEMAPAAAIAAATAPMVQSQDTSQRRDTVRRLNMRPVPP